MLEIDKTAMCALQLRLFLKKTAIKLQNNCVY